MFLSNKVLSQADYCQRLSTFFNVHADLSIYKINFRNVSIAVGELQSNTSESQFLELCLLAASNWGYNPKLPENARSYLKGFFLSCLKVLWVTI